MELTPLIPVGRQVVERYAPSGFRIAGVIWRGPVLVFPDLTLPWVAAAPAAVTEETLKPVVEHGGVQILLLGLGSRMCAVAPALHAALRQAGISVEPMDTGAACRTYNVLLAEDRRVAAALLPPV
ncbi:MAG TPA: Mth938-like domain-containing protein [Stellaceae bacterium]|jgi:uncharacterized protein|nr:Mth938-like domain-containing protein [Stellaceae bacterium]